MVPGSGRLTPPVGRNALGMGIPHQQTSVDFFVRTVRWRMERPVTIGFLRGDRCGRIPEMGFPLYRHRRQLSRHLYSVRRNDPLWIYGELCFWRSDPFIPHGLAARMDGSVRDDRAMDLFIFPLPEQTFSKNLVAFILIIMKQPVITELIRKIAE